MRRSRKIVFFFPSFASSEATAPLGILAVATPLRRAGFEVVLIDSTITPNFKQRVINEVRDALCLGISLVTGPMIRETVDIARTVKEWNPDFPIILGGWHPSLMPKQTLEAPYIDYIVRGQGEYALLELVQHIQAGAAPDFIPGIGFKRGGKMIMTPERPLKPLVEMPPKAYEIADFDAYERGCGKRWAIRQVTQDLSKRWRAEATVFLLVNSYRVRDVWLGFAAAVPSVMRNACWSASFGFIAK